MYLYTAHLKKIKYNSLVFGGVRVDGKKKNPSNIASVLVTQETPLQQSRLIHMHACVCPNMRIQTETQLKHFLVWLRLLIEQNGGNSRYNDE